MGDPWLQDGTTIGMLTGMPRVGKVTVSLPEALLEYVEALQALSGATRSETIATMLWATQREWEQREREVRYTAAYARQPETAADMAFTTAASVSLFAHAGDEWADVAPPVRGADRRVSPARKAAYRAANEAVTTPPRAATPPTVRKATGRVTAKRSASASPVRKAAKRAPG